MSCTPLAILRSRSTRQWISDTTSRTSSTGSWGRSFRHDPETGLPPWTAALLEAEGTTEALAFGTLIDVVRQGHFHMTTSVSGPSEPRGVQQRTTTEVVESWPPDPEEEA